MLKDFRRIWLILNRSEKYKIKLTTFILIFMGILDTIGIISILPLIYLVSNKENYLDNYFINYLNSYFQFDFESFIIFLSIISLLIIFFNNFFKFITYKYAEKVSYGIWLSLHNRLYEYYLMSDYSFHLNNSSNSLLEKLQVRVNAVVAGVITPLFYLLSSISTIFFITILLLINNILVSILIFLFLFLFYFLIFSNLKSKFEKFGEMGPLFSKKAFKLINDSLNSIKEIKITHNERFYLNLFDPIAKKYCNSMINKKIYSIMPSMILEVIVFFVMYILIFAFIFSKQNLFLIAPQIALYFFSFRRLVPSFQEVYQHLAHIRFYKPSLDIIYSDLYKAHTGMQEVKRNIEIVNFNKSISLKDVDFKYPGNNNFKINNLNLTINKGNKIAIIGRSGSGKSTILDLILGILKPNSGSMFVDENQINEKNLGDWQNRFGYVAQSGFISDASIIENVAFSVDVKSIDINKVKKACKIAEISNFIDNELPDSYNSLIGERGIKISGGQRQRICIARALYFENDIIVFDEATSALDTITERKIINNIKKNYDNKTIIIVTHRISSIQDCDEIFFINNGKIEISGKYNKIIDKNKTLEEMITKNNDTI